MSDTSTLGIVLGTQLFTPPYFAAFGSSKVVMCEDRALCTYVRHHQHKLVLMLATMRSQADALRAAGFEVHYQSLDDPANSGFLPWVAEVARRTGADKLVHFDFAARHFERRLAALCAAEGFSRTVLPSPMFMNPLELFDRHRDRRGGILMARYYQQVRRQHQILLTADGRPEGGSWSYDADNRQRLPRSITPPAPRAAALDDHARACIELVQREFPDHPGSAAGFWIPTTRTGALTWLHDFLEQRLAQFGPYEDALSTRSEFLFHSALSPLMNIGLLTPAEVVDAVLQHAAQHAIPLNSLEGFLRQVIGWREFIRGVYERHGAAQRAGNFWAHHRRPGPAFYEATTGLPPLDDAIRLARDRAWNHHIQRLMVVGNIMTLTEIAPRAAYRWFMEMFADAYPWVMEPNVYGMALFSDGGTFATKPYVCGSNYWLKMSDYARGEWCDVVDGLYWRFIARQRDFFERNPRLKVILRSLDRMDSARREHIFAAAEQFLAAHTLDGPA